MSRKIRRDPSVLASWAVEAQQERREELHSLGFAIAGLALLALFIWLLSFEWDGKADHQRGPAGAETERRGQR